MPPPIGTWYVRFPDGRVVLARSTQAVRYHIERGRIPANSRVRRTAEEKWQSLDGTADFADLLSPPSDGAPADSRDVADAKSALGKSNVEYRLFGVGALVNELFNAIDLSLHRNKLWISVSASMSWTVGLIGLSLVFELTRPGVWQYGLAAAVGAIMLFVAGLAGGALSKMTLVEMLHRRRPHWPEIKPRLFRNAWNIMLSQALFLAGIWLPIQGLHHFPEWFPDNPPEVLGIVLTLRLILEIFSLALAGMGLLLMPIIVVEECSLPKALGIWWDLLRSDLSRIFLYETLAVALGVVLTLPLIFPIMYAGRDQDALTDNFLREVSRATLHVVGGLAIAPFAAYLVVANVFIYLNLRYEFFSPNRQ